MANAINTSTPCVLVSKTFLYYGVEGALRCAAIVESLWVFAEFVFVGYKAWPPFLCLGALVSGTDDVP